MLVITGMVDYGVKLVIGELTPITIASDKCHMPILGFGWTGWRLLAFTLPRDRLVGERRLH